MYLNSLGKPFIGVLTNNAKQALYQFFLEQFIGNLKSFRLELVIVY